MSEEHDRDSTPDKPVGYCQPPVSSRFKPGQSGNRKGRPRGSKNINSMLLPLMSEKIAVRESGRKRKLSLSEVMLRKHMHQAASGDVRSFREIIKLLARADYLDPSQADQAGDRLTQEETELLNDFIRRYNREH